jgi:hypothetical protein
MDAVKIARLGFAQTDHFLGNHTQAGGLEFGDDPANVIVTHRTGLDDGQRAFYGHAGMLPNFLIKRLKTGAIILIKGDKTTVGHSFLRRRSEN